MAHPHHLRRSVIQAGHVSVIEREGILRSISYTCWCVGILNAQNLELSKSEHSWFQHSYIVQCHARFNLLPTLTLGLLISEKIVNNNMKRMTMMHAQQVVIVISITALCIFATAQAETIRRREMAILSSDNMKPSNNSGVKADGLYNVLAKVRVFSLNMSLMCYFFIHARGIAGRHTSTTLQFCWKSFVTLMALHTIYCLQRVSSLMDQKQFVLHDLWGKLST